MYVNTSDQPIAYRDDAGKHHVAPGETFELVGAQHAPALLAIQGVETAAEPAPVMPEREAVPDEPLPDAPEPDDGLDSGPLDTVPADGPVARRRR